MQHARHVVTTPPFAYEVCRQTLEKQYASVDGIR